MRRILLAWLALAAAPAAAAPSGVPVRVYVDPVADGAADAATDPGGHEDAWVASSPETGVEAAPADLAFAPDTAGPDPGPPPNGSSGGGCRAARAPGPAATWLLPILLFGRRRRER